ncbi:MAG: phosphoribosylformylglycinamidine cyclo-ligase [bacterium]|nr:phosphoribosylformylglycinamidine cyclo-ligase [bacterium]
MATTYKDSGVDVAKGKEAVERISKVVRSTFNKRVLTGLGLFGSLYDISDIVRDYKEPVLVQSIDGVGTKIEVAAIMNTYSQVGKDIVAHSCNDVLCQGAIPLTFLDYVATDKLDADVLEQIVQGMADACAGYGLSLVGGETAEMPGTYETDHWDIAGAVLGVVEKSKIIDGSAIKKGDVIIGLASEGLHTNGYSLARKVLLEDKGFTVRDVMAELPRSVGAELMRPHKNYTNHVKPLLDKYNIHGIAHITGGGLIENIPRILPAGFDAELQKDSWEVLPIFEAIQQFGEVPEDDMYTTFNMGIGLTLVVPEEEHKAIMADLEKQDDAKATVIGKIIKGKKKVCFV